MDFNKLMEDGAKLYYNLIIKSEKMPPSKLQHANHKFWKDMVLAEKKWEDPKLELPTDIKPFPDVFTDVKKFVYGAIKRLHDELEFKLEPHEIEGLNENMNKINKALGSKDLFEIIKSTLFITQEY
jgi:hypothetical protein